MIGLGVSAATIVAGPIFADEQQTAMLKFADVRIDGPLREQLRSGSIRLVRCAWLLSDEADRHFGTNDAGEVVIRRKQEVEKLGEKAYFTPYQAQELLEQGNRSVLVLSRAQHPFASTPPGARLPCPIPATSN